MAKRASTSVALIFLGLLFLVAIVAWNLSGTGGFISTFTVRGNDSDMTLTIHGTRIAAEVANTEAKRAQGLSGRAGLPDRRGLLMVFDTDVSPGIWMKDMRFPIDIVWIDKDWKVVEVTPSVEPDTYPNVFYPTDTLVRYVLELPAGFSDIQNIKAGDTVEH